MVSFLLHNLWALTVLAFEAALAGLAIRHGFFRRLPVFTTYLFSLFVVEATRSVTVMETGITSKAYFWTYWLTQALLLTLRGMVVAEICWTVLGRNAGVWRLSRIILILVAGALCTLAAIAAWHNQHHLAALITTLERDLELAIVGTLVFAFLFTRYYFVPIERAAAWIAAGIVFYSSVQVANHEFMFVFRDVFYPVYSRIVVNSFNIALLLWLGAVWKPLPAFAPAAAMLGESAYGEVIPQVNLRLRELNSRLLEILR